METTASYSGPQGTATDPNSGTSGSVNSFVNSFGSGTIGNAQDVNLSADAFQNDSGASSVSTSIGQGLIGVGPGIDNLAFEDSEPPVTANAVGTMPSASHIAQSSAKITYTATNNTASPVVGDFDYLVSAATLGFSDQSGFIIAAAFDESQDLPIPTGLDTDGDAAAGYLYTLSVNGVEAFSVGAEITGNLNDDFTVTAPSLNGNLGTTAATPASQSTFSGGYTAFFGSISDTLGLQTLAPGQSVSVSVLLESYSAAQNPLAANGFDPSQSVRSNFGDPNNFNFSLTFNTVPEPSRAVLLLGAGMVMVGRRRRATC